MAKKFAKPKRNQPKPVELKKLGVGSVVQNLKSGKLARVVDWPNNHGVRYRTLLGDAESDAKGPVRIIEPDHVANWSAVKTKRPAKPPATKAKPPALETRLGKAKAKRPAKAKPPALETKLGKAKAKRPAAVGRKPKPTKAKPAPPAPPLFRLGAKDAAVVVLRDLPAKAEGLTADELMFQILDRGLWSTTGATPAATLYAAIIREIANKGPAARFRRVTDSKRLGVFALNE